MATHCGGDYGLKALHRRNSEIDIKIMENRRVLHLAESSQLCARILIDGDIQLIFQIGKPKWLTEDAGPF